MPDKKLLDYFIDHTNARFEEVKTEMKEHRLETNKNFEKLLRYGLIAVLVCIALSPAGEKILTLMPQIIEFAAAATIGR